jgi:hypothetical protein
MTIRATYTFTDATNTAASYKNIIQSNLTAAVEAWSKVLAGDANIQISIQTSGSLGSNYGGGFAADLVTHGVSGGKYQTEATFGHQIRTGIDANGSKFDANIIINGYGLDEFFFDPSPYDSGGDIPSDKYDFYSLMLYSVGKALGFHGFQTAAASIYSRTYKTIYDDLVVYKGGTPYFSGENVRKYYGSDLALNPNDIYSINTKIYNSEQFTNSAVSESVLLGQRRQISVIEKAILADQGIGTDQADILKAHIDVSGKSIKLNAGAGTDTVVYDGRKADYSVKYSAADGTYKVTGKSYADTLISAEQIRFSDGTYWIEDVAGVNNGVHRFYNTATNSHFYTGSNAETNSVRTSMPYAVEEGFAFASASGKSGLEVFRFQNEKTGAYFYTISTSERDSILKSLPQFSYQGSSFKAYTTDSGPQEELYRFYNTASGAHFFTTSEAERDNIVANLPLLTYEGVAFYVDIMT